MKNKPKKKRFEVQENETIGDCLDRIKAEGYMPVRRSEEPVFHEVKVNGEIKREVVKQRIVFEGKII